MNQEVQDIFNQIEFAKQIDTVASICQILETLSVKPEYIARLLKCEASLKYRLYRLHEQLRATDRTQLIYQLQRENSSLSQGKQIQARLIASYEQSQTATEQSQTATEQYVTTINHSTEQCLTALFQALNNQTDVIQQTIFQDYLDNLSRLQSK